MVCLINALVSQINIYYHFTYKFYIRCIIIIFTDSNPEDGGDIVKDFNFSDSE